MKILISFIFGVTVGVTIINLSNNSQKKLTPDHLTWAEEGIGHISSHIDSNKQLEEAKKYYGKAVVLFLSSLYHQDKISQSIASETKLKVSEVDILPNQQVEIYPNKKPTLEKQNTNTPSQAEKDIDRMVTFRQSPIHTNMAPEVKKLNGIFHGTFTHKTGKYKGRVDQVFMEIALEMQKQKLTGLIRIQLIDPEGNIYSNSSGEGENTKLRLIKERPNQIYIEPAPGEFILMDVSNSEQMSGDYYDSNGSYKGTIMIWKS